VLGRGFLTQRVCERMQPGEDARVLAVPPSGAERGYHNRFAVLALRAAAGEDDL
jgi:hypothetical protein